MKIKRLVIENFKSIERIELIEPNPFTVFVGPNGSGKSNIFEALEFFNVAAKAPGETADGLFGGSETYQPRNKESAYNVNTHIEVSFNTIVLALTGLKILGKHEKSRRLAVRHNYSVKSFDISATNRSFFEGENVVHSKYYSQFINSFLRLFINNTKIQRLNYQDNVRLTLSADNLETVLKRILRKSDIKQDIIEWLQLFIPRFERVEIRSSKLTDTHTLLVYDVDNDKPFNKQLISDGTYNILVLLTAVYQSKEPQFLCIEEPENGLNPKVVKEFVNLCRYACEEYGHYIWLNTHSQTLVSALTPEEIVLVDKVEGATQTKQVKGMNLYDLPMDEAWLSNALGGGLPW